MEFEPTTFCMGSGVCALNPRDEGAPACSRSRHRSEFERFLLKFSAMTNQGADGSALTAKAILASPYMTRISLCS
jgi:hypothetical protein